MNWWQFLIPTVLIAIFVRVEAKILGPYWSWIEMVPHLSNSREDARVRRRALIRRVAIPGIIGLAIALLWPTTYGELEGAVIGGSAAGLILWPTTVYGRPYGLRGLTSWLLYGSFVGAFIATGALGASLAAVVESQGGPVAYVRNEGTGALILFVGSLFFTGALDKTFSTLSKNVKED